MLHSLQVSSGFSVLPLRVSMTTSGVPRHQILPQSAVILASRIGDAYFPSKLFPLALPICAAAPKRNNFPDCLPWHRYSVRLAAKSKPDFDRSALHVFRAHRQRPNKFCLCRTCRLERHPSARQAKSRQRSTNYKLHSHRRPAKFGKLLFSRRSIVAAFRRRRNRYAFTVDSRV